MKAITPILELKFRNDIIIPGIENKISIDPDFFFIICQNTKNTFGRKDLPEKIKIKIKVINYPDRVKEEIENICESICEKLFRGRKDHVLTVEDARLCGDFMMLLNENEILTPWSLRDISKLFNRINKQSLNPRNFINLGIKENILFYILSSTNDSLISERLPEVVNLISEVFKINEMEGKRLKDLYNAVPLIKSKDNKLYIEKDFVNIFYCTDGKKNYKLLNGLPSVLNALFKILITCDDEPILISGPSSFKTFLAKLIFKDEKSEVISLNSESTISQLIGSTTLLTSEKAKNYYLMQIYEILQVNNIDNYLKDLENFELNEDKIKQNIKDFMNDKNIDENHTFYYALRHFQEKLFSEEKNKKSLFDMKIEFKPGIFISARIKGYNLILKNITYVKTENLERLNEALTGNKKITLNEDTQNSFTPENNKEISFKNNFRVVGTCNEGEETSLSEAFLSRFTLIYVDKYQNEEELKVLKDVAGDIKDVKNLNHLLDNYYRKFNDINRMNLSQKINCFKITKELDKLKESSHQKNLNLVAYYLLKGLNEKREEKISEINNIFNINQVYDDNIKNSPLEIINKDKKLYLKSKLSGLIIDIIPKQEKNDLFEEMNEKKNMVEIPSLIFTNKIKEIIDAIHFGLSAKVPIVLEGEYGQGKKSALEYFARLSKLEIIHVPISKSTKVDDLLCKMTFKKNEKGNFSLVNSKTPLCYAIECIDHFPNKLVVLEGINNASPAVLEILNLIYGPKGTKILLSNGSTISKGNMNLISIFNQTDDFPREKLPGNLINNSLYFIAESPTNKDICHIISNLFNEAGLPKNEQEEFTDSFLKAQKIAKEGVGEYPITLHEVRKYISFRKSIPNIERNIFMLFIFNYHFSRKENILKAKKELKLDTLFFNPIISYERDRKNNKDKYLIFLSSKKLNSGYLKIKINDPKRIKSEKLIKKFDSMTLTEKICFLFILCCIQAKKTPIIQGETASGKSFIIKIFAEILGEDLSIYQLNANSGMSIFTGQSVMKEEFDDKEREKLQKILKLLKIKDKSVDNLNSEDFIELKSKINKKLKSKDLTIEQQNEYKNALDTLTIIQSPLNRFMHQDSELITGIKTGKWIALDGIEMASTQISEKLSPLCDEVPSLNIFESGLEDLNFDSSNIHPNFRLFIIYNPSSQNAKKIDQGLFNKCIKFSLLAIDSNERDTTTMLYESISTNSDIDEQYYLWSNLCARIATYHSEESKLSKGNTNLLAGNVPFTARNLSFILNDYHKTFINSDITIESWLQSIFDNYYWRSYTDYSKKGKKSFMEDTFKIIKGTPEQKFIIINKNDFKEESKEIFQDLISIQNYAVKNIEFKEFFFDKFLSKCLMASINKEKLQSLKNNLDDTILLLDNNYDINEILKNRFYQILFIRNNFENIINNIENISGFEDELPLRNDQLLKYEEIKIYLLRMRFLHLILKKNDVNESASIYESNLNYKLFTPYANELAKKLSALIKNKNKSSFEDLTIFLCEFPEAFQIIENYYPFNNDELKIGQLKFSNYYIYLWSHLYIKKFNFSIRIGKNRYDIIFHKEDQDKRLTPYFVLNSKNSLILTRESFIKKNNKKDKDKYIYVQEESENFTEKFIKWVIDNYNTLNKVSPLKTLEEIDNLQLESSLFFTSKNSSSLVGRIWSIIINLTDKFLEIIEYFQKSFCFLEVDALNIFQFLYNKLDKNHLDDLIDNIKSISFFCDTESILWKYRNLIINFEKNKEKDFNRYYEFLKNQKINADEEIELIKKESDNIDKLNIYWDDKKIVDYKEKLIILRSFLLFYKNKGKEDEEITKLRKDATTLLLKLEEKSNNYKSSIKLSLKIEITNFLESERPTKELFKIIENKVNVFLDLIGKESKNKVDTIYFPEKNIDKNDKNISTIMKNYQLYEIIFWFSSVDFQLNELLDPEIDEKNFMELLMELYNDSDLDSIITYINEKKLELNKDKKNNDLNKNLSFKDKQVIKQMLRGLLLTKIKNNNISINNLNNFVKNINSRMKQNEEISKEEYYFTNIIMEKYSKNLKILMPSFDVLDIFYLFFKYEKNQCYKLGGLFNDITPNLAEINNIAKIILEKSEKNEYKNMTELSNDISRLLYENICNDKCTKENKISMKDYLLKEAKKVDKSHYKADLLSKIADYLKFIYEIDNTIFNNQKKSPDFYRFDLDDFKNLLNEKNKLMNCSNLFKKDNIYKILDLQPSFIFFANNNQSFLNELFTHINNSENSIIDDLFKKKDLKEINYLPFWLFILRNISSLNCLEYGRKIDNNISNAILKTIKNRIIDCLNNENPLNLQWLNLLTENVSAELLDHNIHLFYIFFNSLINNLNLNEKIAIIKDIIINDLIKYYTKIIDLSFDNKLNCLLEYDIYKNDHEFVLKFTKDPSAYLYEKIKAEINGKFADIVNEENIYNLTLSFNDNIKKIINSFQNKVKEIDKILFQREFQTKLNDYNKTINTKFNEIDNYNKQYNSIIEKIIKQNSDEFSYKQISNVDIENLDNIKKN